MVCINSTDSKISRFRLRNTGEIKMIWIALSGQQYYVMYVTIKFVFAKQLAIFPSYAFLIDSENFAAAKRLVAVGLPNW